MKDLSDSRMLIVDDVKANVDILVQALRDEYKLRVALDGTAALRSIDRSAPDLVLLDIMMPDVDGYEVCRQLRARGGDARAAGHVPELARRGRRTRRTGSKSAATTTSPSRSRCSRSRRASRRC